MHALAMLELHTAKEQQQQQQQHQPRSHRQRPRSKELQQSFESLDRLDGAVSQHPQSQSQSQRQRHHHHHHHHHHQQRQQQQQQSRYNHVEQEERDDTEDNLADEEFEDDEVGRDVRQKRLLQSEHSKQKNDKQQQQQSQHNEEMEQEQQLEREQGEASGAAPLSNGSLRLEANVINDELKYGAAHHNHQSMDSNPLESQSEWSDDDCREEATGKECE